MTSVHIHFQDQRFSEKEILIPDNTPLIDIIRKEAPGFLFPCGGNKACGQCLVWVKGEFNNISLLEQTLISRRKEKTPKGGFIPRMACFCNVTESGSVEMIIPKIDEKPLTAAFEESLPPYDGTNEDALGVAIDIGSTTISLVLFHLKKGALLGTIHDMNRQSAYGADVLSRIVHATENGYEILRDIIREQLSSMLLEALEQNNGSPDHVERLVITGNTTMLHFFTGLDPKSLGVSPFITQSLFGEDHDANLYFPYLSSAAKVYFPPCISAYVGADITCGLLFAGITEKEKSWLLVDVGTNGEMILKSNDKLLCCATAAGPAFEGAEIQMGMPAVAGAVYRVYIQEDGSLRVLTVGNEPAAGLCGTGLISTINLMLSEGIADETGLIEEDNHAFTQLVQDGDDSSTFLLGDSGVYITQRDLRNIQLAKAAIAAGIDTLLHEAGINPENLDILFLAGGFGNGIDPVEAAGIGLIPQPLVGKVQAAGNTALKGAIQMLFSLEARKKTEKEAALSVEIPLSTHPVFMDRYIENMSFGGE